MTTVPIHPFVTADITKLVSTLASDMNASSLLFHDNLASITLTKPVLVSELLSLFHPNFDIPVSYTHLTLPTTPYV